MHSSEWFGDALKILPGRDFILIIEDFNAKVGFTAEYNDVRNTFCKYGFGERNQREEWYFVENNLFIANTGFQHRPRHLYTCRSPGEIHRNQTDLILIKSFLRLAIKNKKNSRIRLR